MKKILIIEDEENLREATADFLSMNNYQVIKAKDGIDGIKKALEHLPDLIISDIMMPNLDGFQVINFLRQSSEMRNVPFIFLSAKAEKSDLRSGMNLGADDYLTKPFKIQELLNAVESRLKRKEAITKELNAKIDSIVNIINSASTHEYNTSLNGILGFTNLLIEDFENFSKSEIINILLTIRSSSERLHGITKNVLRYAFIQKYDNVLNVYPKPSINAQTQVITYRAVEIAQSFRRANDLEINIEDIPVQVSEMDLVLILEEIIDNAFKFSREGSKVSVTTIKTDSKVEFIVTDHGRGISPQHLSEIAPFAQFDKHLFAQQGMGLGLYLAKRMTELNGGKLKINSELGTETNVLIEFQR